MSDIKMLALGNNLFRPATQQDEELVKRFKTGDLMSCKVTRTRNAGFHRKMFALLNVGFDAFEPTAEYKGEVVAKSFEQFREDVTILAGHYTMSARLDGSYRVRAKSISFASTEQDEFEKVYSAIANVILEKVLTNYSQDDLDNVVNQILGFV